MKTLIKNGFVLTENLTFQKNDILINNDKIESIGKSIQKYAEIHEFTLKSINKSRHHRTETDFNINEPF